MLRLIPFIIVGILLVPIGVGLIHIIIPAFGHAPMLGFHELNLTPFKDFFALPAIFTSIWLSYWIGLVTAFISLILVILFVSSYHNSKIFIAVNVFLRPVIAVPHAAAAFGLAFLIMPSGFFIRLISPNFTGFNRPPDWLIINDIGGFALLFGLIMKEIPFILLVVLVALAQVKKSQTKITYSMGHGKIWGWLICVFPKIYKQIRLPIYAVVAYASSVVDIAIILGPSSVPSLAVRTLKLMNDADLSMRLIGSSAALMQLLITLFALFSWWIGEKIISHFAKILALKGFRFRKDFLLRILGLAGVLCAVIFIGFGLIILFIWSISFIWTFPDILPKSYSFATWIKQFSNIIDVSLRAAIIAAISSFISLILVVLALQNEYLRRIKISPFSSFILFLPLLLPQISFLFGLFVFMIWAGFETNIYAVIFVHIIFIIPYSYLLLVDAWHDFDARLLNVGKMFGKSDASLFFSVRMPILLRSILMVFALGFAISIAQYLPTLLIGAGRVPTITTEAVALASGGNRRLIGAYAIVQSLLPFIIFAFAAIIPAFLYKNREGLK